MEQRAGVLTLPADDTARAILGKAVAIEIGVAGFSSSSSHAADVLTDLVASFLQDVARQANQSGRTLPFVVRPTPIFV